MPRVQTLNLVSENKKLNTKVYKVLYKDQLYIVKSYPKSLYKLYKNEIEINSYISHKYIIPYHFALSTSTRVNLFFDCAHYGDLFDIIHSGKITLDANASITCIIIPILKCVKYLHEHDIAHMDIKPENIFIGANIHPYLGDFGLSIDLNNLARYRNPTRIVGTKVYMSPEQVYDEVQDFKKIDIWCMGLLIYELFFKKLPYTLHECKDKNSVITAYNSIELEKTVDPRINYLIANMLKLDPRERIDISTALNKLT